MATGKKNITEYMLEGSNNVIISNFNDEKLIAYLKILLSMIKDELDKDTKCLLKIKVKWVIGAFEDRYKKSLDSDSLSRYNKKQFFVKFLSNLKKDSQQEKSEIIRNIEKAIEEIVK